MALGAISDCLLNRLECRGAALELVMSHFVSDSVHTIYKARCQHNFFTTGQCRVAQGESVQAGELAGIQTQEAGERLSHYRATTVVFDAVFRAITLTEKAPARFLESTRCRPAIPKRAEDGRLDARTSPSAKQPKKPMSPVSPPSGRVVDNGSRGAAQLPATRLVPDSEPRILKMACSDELVDGPLAAFAPVPILSDWFGSFPSSLPDVVNTPSFFADPSVGPFDSKHEAIVVPVVPSMIAAPIRRVQSCLVKQL